MPAATCWRCQDVHCLNPEWGKIPTPNLDRLAGDGMRFTDAHSGSAMRTQVRVVEVGWAIRGESGVGTTCRQPQAGRDREAARYLGDPPP
jgi:hypothetical protein